MVTHIFLPLLSNQFKRLVSARDHHNCPRGWKLSFLARGERRSQSAADLSRRETPQCGYCVKFGNQLKFIRKKIFSSSPTIPVVCKDPTTYCFVIKFVYIMR